MSERQPDLVAEEGVDEGSAASTAESGPDGGQRADSGVLGPPPQGSPPGRVGPPVDMESAESRAARAERAPGQQMQEGER